MSLDQIDTATIDRKGLEQLSMNDPAASSGVSKNSNAQGDRKSQQAAGNLTLKRLKSE